MELSDKALEKAVKYNMKITKKELSKEEKEANVIEWTTFYRRNLDIFNEDYLGIKISLFQKQRINSWCDNNVSNTIASRGSAKSFDVAIFCLDMCLLYSNMQILVTSKYSSQANNIIDEKIDKIFTSENSQWSSPVLIKLREEGWIKIGQDTNKNAYVEFGNGSRIFCRPCGESCRYIRANIVIADEFVIIEKKSLYEDAIPTLEIRRFGGRPIDYKEETKQILLSSAKTKTNWGWNQLVKCVSNHYKEKRVKYGFFTGDIFTAIANGIQTKNLYITAKEGTDEMSFEQEYLNIFLSNNELSIFKFEDFEKNQKLIEAFYPREPIEIIEEKQQTYKFDDDWIRIVVTDIAVATGNENDNTVIICMAVNKNTGDIKVEYITAKNGLNSIKQVILMKRIFYEYHARYFEMDSRGVGYTMYDMFTVETYDDETGEIYPAWTTHIDKDLQISSDDVIKDRVTRAISSEAEDVIIPFVATGEINSQMHLALRKTLRDGKISFLIDDSQAQAEFENNDDHWLLHTSEERADKILPYLQTKYMINEAVSLETIRQDNGNIKVKEAKRTDVKDRYITVAMGNLLCNNIYNKYSRSNDEDSENIDLNDWAFLANACKV